MIIWRLANLVYMLVEGDCTVNENTRTLDTVRCFDVDRSSIECGRSAAPAARWREVVPSSLQLLQSFQDSGTVRYNPAGGEVLGCTVLKLASFYLSVPRTTVCHQRTVRGSIPNELITLLTGDMYKVNNSGPRTEPWGTPYSQSVLGDFPVQHARTVYC